MAIQPLTRPAATDSSESAWKVQVSLRSELHGLTRLARMQSLAQCNGIHVKDRQARWLMGGWLQKRDKRKLIREPVASQASWHLFRASADSARRPEQQAVQG